MNFPFDLISYTIDGCKIMTINYYKLELSVLNIPHKDNVKTQMALYICDLEHNW